MRRNYVVRIVLVILCVLNSACSDTKWWIGTWAYDKEKTFSTATEDQKRDLSSIGATLALMDLETNKIEFTDNHFIRTHNSGSPRRAVEYSIIKKDANMVSFKIESNVIDFFFEDGYMFQLIGDKRIRIFFKITR